jgi:hypothetical protein
MNHPMPLGEKKGEERGRGGNQSVPTNTIGNTSYFILFYFIFISCVR